MIYLALNEEEALSPLAELVLLIIFGLGWALAGACPGPMYVLAGAGYASILIVIFGAIAGTFLYGLVKDKLPH